MTLPRTTADRSQRRPWGRTHGTIAVAALLLSALDHLVTAVIGWPPVAYMTRRVAAPIADAWRAAAWRSSPRAPIAIITIRTPPAPERTTDDAHTAN
jgi:hypothetical protein